MFLAAASWAPLWADAGSGSQFAGVNCAPGACQAEVSRVKAAPGRTTSRGGARGSDGGGSPESSGSASQGWEREPGQMFGPHGAPLPMQDFGGRPAVEAGQGEGSQVPVEAVVQRAVKQLVLPKPVIRTNPDADRTQVVHVPTWMWVDRSTWDPVSASAEVEGLKVTATARPQRAVWSMGEGGSVVCRGPGTPYSDSYAPKAASPDCGYTYHRASIGVPGGAFTVSVRVTWDVEWHGGGQGGVVPGLVMTASRRLVVDEVQAIVTR